MLGAKDTRRQQRRVDRARLADGQGGDRNARRHLHNGKQRINPRKHCRLHRYAQHRQVGLGRTHAWQVGRAAGTGDDHLDATRLGFFSVLEQQVRGAVGRNHFHLVGDAELFQHIGGVAKGGPIGLGAHDHANQCTHRRASSLWAPAGASKNNKPRRMRGLIVRIMAGRNRPKAAQYTAIRQINSPCRDHLSSGAKQRFY
ncbi:hypothetical protein D3C81_688920 [compost metagenome]